MSKKEFIMPAGVKKDEAKSTSTYARYEVYPFENGYGQTVGIALRRVLLSSIEGVAITSIRVKGADHEFTSIPGIAEDVTDIIIALKQVLIKTAPVIPEKITISKKGPCTVTAGDFQKDNAVEIVNPDLPIATVSAGHSFELEAEIALGYGFHMARENRPTDQIIGQIPIDSIHSPVTRVNFDAVAHRVGERTDYEKLILDIWTDGRTSPEEALKTASAVLRSHLDVFVGHAGEEIIEFEDVALSACRRDLRSERIGVGAAFAAGRRDVEAVAGQTQGGRLPDAAGGADDECETVRCHKTKLAPEKKDSVGMHRVCDACLSIYCTMFFVFFN